MIIVPGFSSPPPGPSHDLSTRPGASPDRVDLGSAPRPVLPPRSPAPAPAAARLQGRLEVDGSSERPMAPGIPAAWTFRFADAEGKPVSSFEPEHGKAMHLVAVTADLDGFAHLHPDLGPDGGFRIFANQPSCDPDNADAARAVTRPGRHLFFATVRPAGAESQVHRFDLEATGEATPVPLVPDPELRPGTIRKFFDAAGRPGEAGAAYEVTLKLEDHRRHGMFHLEVHLRQAADDGRGGVEYQDIRDVEPWLGAPGHAVMIGASGEGAGQRFFSHLHAGGGHGGHATPPGGGHPPGHPPPGGGGELGPAFRFAAPPEELAPPGLYRVWTQFRHAGQVRTFPFAFQLG